MLLGLLPRHPLSPQPKPVVVSHVGVVGSERSAFPTPPVVSREGSMLVFSVACADVTGVTRTVRLLACKDLLVKLR